MTDPVFGETVSPKGQWAPVCHVCGMTGESGGEFWRITHEPGCANRRWLSGETVSRVGGTRAYHEAVAHAERDNDAELENLALTISPLDAYRRPQMLNRLVQGTLRLLREKRETR